MKENNNKIQWCIDQHKNTNHWYDKYLPYEFHLRMVVQAAKDFIHLLKDLDTDVDDINLTTEDIISASWGHDLIEDCRVSYNDVRQHLGQEAADIVYAVSNDKGKNRKERAGEKYYEGIRNTPGAVFVKLCDRIANVQYSKMTKSRMFEMYKGENLEFTKSLGLRGDGVEYPGHEYYPMYEYLMNLFKD
jgi:(p)ppGpp synthase/HD superfamily hydrolase